VEGVGKEVPLSPTGKGGTDDTAGPNRTKSVQFAGSVGKIRNKGKIIEEGTRLWYANRGTSKKLRAELMAVRIISPPPLGKGSVRERRNAGPHASKKNASNLAGRGLADLRGSIDRL